MDDRIDRALAKEAAGQRELHRILAHRRRTMEPRQFWAWCRRELGWNDRKTRTWMNARGWR